MSGSCQRVPPVKKDWPSKFDSFGKKLAIKIFSEIIARAFAMATAKISIESISLCPAQKMEKSKCAK